MAVDVSFGSGTRTGADSGADSGTNGADLRVIKVSKRSLRNAVRRAVRECGVRAAKPAPKVVAVAAAPAKHVREVCDVDPFGEDLIALERDLRTGSLAAGDGPVVSNVVIFNRKACPILVEGDDAVDDVRIANPTRHRFVLCGAGDIEIERFILLEDAIDAAKDLVRKQGLKNVIYALKSGKAMAYSSLPK